MSSVIINVHRNTNLRHMFNLNMKVKSIPVISVIFKLQRRLISIGILELNMHKPYKPHIKSIVRNTHIFIDIFKFKSLSKVKVTCEA